VGGPDEQREQIRHAGLELAPANCSRPPPAGGARLEGITAVLLLTDEDDSTPWPRCCWRVTSRGAYIASPRS